jgi:stage V sporulation protein SpoVS
MAARYPQVGLGRLAAPVHAACPHPLRAPLAPPPSAPLIPTPPRRLPAAAAVAGKIAHALRAHEWPTLLVAGNSSIHTAVKCCITAGRFVSAEGLSIEFEPRFRDADHSRALLALNVMPSLPGGPPAAGMLNGAAAPPFEIKVSMHSRHAKVGAALSARLAEGGGRAVVLLALGETAIANAVMAAAHAGHYLAAEPAGLRLAAQAHSVSVVKDGDQLTGVQLWVRRQRAGEGLSLPPPPAAGPAPDGLSGGGSGGDSGSGLPLELARLALR